MDYTQDEEDVRRSEADLKRDLEAAVRRMLDAGAELETAKDELKLKQAAYDAIAQHEVPDLLDALGKKRVMLPSGLEVKLDENITASPPEATRDAAYQWLRDNGHAGLIKRQVITEFGAGQDNMAADLVAKLQEAEQKYNITEKSSVHASTLSAWVRNQLKDGNTIPEALFGVYRKRLAKIG